MTEEVLPLNTDIYPVYDGNEIISFRLNWFIASAIESALLTAQNIASYRDPSTVLAGGIALDPNTIYSLRIAFSDASRTEKDTDGFVYVHKAHVAKAAGYLGLLSANEHNKNVFIGAEKMHYGPVALPREPELAERDIPIWKIRRRKFVRRLWDDYETLRARASAQIQDQEERRAKSEAVHAIAFDAASFILAILESSQENPEG